MAHEMIEEGKILKMIHSVLQDSLLATATGNSATSSDNSTTISKTTTDTVDTSPTQYIPSNATTTGDRTQSKHQSESQSQRDLKRQRTYEFEIEISKPPNHPVITFLTSLEHKQQKSPDTEIITLQHGGLERNNKRARESDGKYEKQNTTTTSQGHNLDVGGGSAALTRTTTPQGHPDPWANADTNETDTPQGDTPDVGSGGVASLTAIEAEKNVQTNTTLSTIVQTTHGLLTRAGATDEVWLRQRNPKRRRGLDNEDKEQTTMAASQGDIGTSAENKYTRVFGIQVGTDTYPLRTEPGTLSTQPKKYKKPKSGSQKINHPIHHTKEDVHLSTPLYTKHLHSH
jgi:hypothetical protein